MTIKKVLTTEVKEGMVIAMDVFDGQGRLVVPRETRLDAKIIEKLEKYSVFVVKIFEGYDEEGGAGEIVGFYEKLSTSLEFEQFEGAFNKATLKLRNNFENIASGEVELDEKEILSGVQEIIQVNKSASMLDMLNCMRGYDDLTYVHCISVALVCNVMAGWLGMSKSDTDELVLAGLLHDIGKLKIPKEIITKKGKLTDAEYRVVKYHPQLGYDILKNTNLSERVKDAALMHHERYDGGGYPSGLSGEKITEFGRIVAIADVYDAMTANRVYRDGLCPYDVIEHFQKDMRIYDPYFLLVFLEHTAESYVSNKVQLSNGEEGKILMINKTNISRPVVMVGDKVRDLSRDSQLKILKLL